MRIRFLTSTPLNIQGGSGTYVGIRVLADALRALGHTVAIETPRLHLPVYTAKRLLYNRLLAPSEAFDVTVGFDLDGYRIARGGAHVAALKGVIADEIRFEKGLTRWTMSAQARRERLHVRRAALVLVTSRYSGERARQFYGLSELPSVVPELIDLAEWRKLLRSSPAEPSGRFTVLFVGRLYRRKRLDILLRAAAGLRARLPELEVRIVGDGPHAATLRRMARRLPLEATVTWLGDVTRTQLAAEYNRSDVFCLPSDQEGFGIVLLEAMAAGKPVVGARAGAIPEVLPHGLLCEPGSPEALAAAIESLYHDPGKRAALGREGSRWVEQFDASRVADRFLEALLRVARPGGVATCTSA